MNDFSSDRKLMSVVVKEITTGRYFMFIKGADDKIQNIRSPLDKEDDQSEEVFKTLTSYGSMGLRTLMFAMREMS